MHNIANNLKFLRKQSHLSQYELAKLLGISRSAVSSYENGTRSPNRDILIKFAVLFNVSTDFILGHTGQSTDYNKATELLHEIKGLLESSDVDSENKAKIISEINNYLHSRFVKS